MGRVNETTRPVVVTRAEAPGSGLSGELAGVGLPVLHWPVVGIEPVDPQEWAGCRNALGTFDWIVFTSVHAVEAVTEAVCEPPHARIAAVGPSTAEALRERGWRVDLIGSGHGAEGLLGPLAEAGVRGRRVLHPASSRALPTLEEGLGRLGAEVVRLIAYRTVAAALDLNECRGWIARAGLGAVTFASPSAVIELARALGDADFARLLAGAPALAIGPTTGRELETRAIKPVLAAQPTLRGLALACRTLMLGIQAGPRSAGPEQDGTAGSSPEPRAAPAPVGGIPGWDAPAAQRTHKRLQS